VLHIRQWLAVGLVLTAIQPVAADVIVKANVDGEQKTIGELSVTSSAIDAGVIFGKFSLAPEFAYLDDWYDFPWVNVLTRYELPTGTAQQENPLLGKLPGIDPAPPPKNKEEDIKPFYYNDKEWLPSGAQFKYTFKEKEITFAIHSEGKYTQFFDRPGAAYTDSKFFFTTFLAVESKTDDEWNNSTFALIGAFDWIYTNNSNADNGTSEWTRISGATNAADTKLVNDAIANAAFKNDAGKVVQPFEEWKAIDEYNLTACTVPEPSSLAMVATGVLFLGTGTLMRFPRNTNRVA
jgi:hypothetical protein